MVHEIDRVRKEAGIKTQQDLADLAGITLRYYQKLKNGNTNNPDRSILERIAKILNTPAPKIFPHYYTVPQSYIVGYIGAGATIYPIDDYPIVHSPHLAEHTTLDGLELIDAPHSGLLALRVTGDSMEPVYPENTIIYYSSREGVYSECINKTVIVKVDDGRLLLKRLRNGTEFGKYNLLSTNSTIIENVTIEWVAKVEYTKPA